MEDNLKRFIEAHKRDYERAYEEIKEGHKQGHWIWYIFPQLRGLGKSSTSIFYGLDGIDEAREYYQNYYLRDHLISISSVLVNCKENDIINIVGYPDNLKINSSMTLFNYVDPEEEIFTMVIDKYYNGEKDLKTLKLIKKGRI